MRRYRKGHRTGRLSTAEGEVEFSVPQVRDTEEPFVSRVRAELPRRTEALEDLAVEMNARGLSTRDIETTFCDGKGRSLLSRTAVSRLTERLWEEYQAFATSDLSEHELVYLFADGIAERLHAGERKEPVLCAWGICRDGQKVLLSLTPGTKEDAESCRAFRQDLKRRRPAGSAAGGDGRWCGTDPRGGGVLPACGSVRQRCLAHRMRNLQAKVPEAAWPEVKARALACYQAPSAEVARVLRDVDTLQAELDDTHRRRVAPATTRSGEVTPSRISSKKGS